MTTINTFKSILILHKIDTRELKNFRITMREVNKKKQNEN